MRRKDVKIASDHMRMQQTFSMRENWEEEAGLKPHSAQIRSSSSHRSGPEERWVVRPQTEPKSCVGEW